MRQHLRCLYLTLLLAIPLIAGSKPATEEDYERLVLDEGILLLEWRSEFSPSQQQTLRDWLSSVTTAMSKVHGSWPLPSIRVVLQGYPGSSAVPFARVLREDPQGVHFYLSPERSLDDYKADWTAYHEFSHLFIPYPGRSDLWFSEGLATYYQNLVQYRAGVLTATEARERLAAGFARGEADAGHTDLTLTELSRQMRERRAFMRVYWSGTLYFMQADLALRSSTHTSGQDLSLDQVLHEFSQCCRQQRRRWSGRELAAEFDRIAGTRLFVPLFDRYAVSTALPSYAEALQSPELDTLLPLGD